MALSFPTPTYNIVITCADGLENSLQQELAQLKIDSYIEKTGKLTATVGLTAIYHVCLWSRIASRVLLPLVQADISSDNQQQDIPQALYELATSYDWTGLFGVEQTFAIRLALDKRVNANQQFTMLRIKDAIADCFNRKLGKRPDVDGKNPHMAIYATVNPKQASIYLDLSGDSLHRRGYRVAMTEAPLKENLAAALLYATGWHTGQYDALIDPMCGSGTFIIEALLMHCDYAVGLGKRFGFSHWQAHDETLWQQLLTDANERFHTGLGKPMPTVFAYDIDTNAIKATHKNLLAAGLAVCQKNISLEQRALAHLPTQFTNVNAPLVITNPPYGERLGDKQTLKALYQGLGLKVQHSLTHISHPEKIGFAVLAANVEQADTLPITNPQTLRCHNGALTVYFRYGNLQPLHEQPLISQFSKQAIQLDDAQEFVNRLQKNLQKLKKQANKEQVSNLRLYDADLPNFNLVIDVYGNHLHVQEYAPPKKLPAEVAKKRFNLALHAIRTVFGVNREQVFIKTRARQSGTNQYEKKSDTGKFYVVQEGNCYFYVNFTNYLDTGLFLDHRPLRLKIAEVARGKSVLNLFAYTCTASVHAAVAGAKTVTSVDLSQNYLDWGKNNFTLNGLAENSNYPFIAADVFTWIKENTEKYDVIFIDPPTFSNSKKFKGTFDVQRDHVPLIKRAMNRLNAGGVLYFSNNYQKFTLDDSLSKQFDVTNITPQTIGFDFNPKKPIHQSWQICHK